MKKIMFNDKFGLTKAVLEGRKTMTRRIISTDETKGGVVPVSFWSGKWCGAHGRPLKRQPYKVGEVVAVAQKYKDVYWHNDFDLGNWSNGFIMESPGWNNKMFVCADMMPHQIRITNVRVEQLQDISDEDCLLEGIERVYYGDEEWFKAYNTKDGCKCAPTPKEAFAALIDKTSGKGTWASNPWVFVYEFELVK